jgi:N-acetylmuramoyl-L-alanine amidase
VQKDERRKCKLQKMKKFTAWLLMVAMVCGSAGTGEVASATQIDTEYEINQVGGVSLNGEGETTSTETTATGDTENSATVEQPTTEGEQQTTTEGEQQTTTEGEQQTTTEENQEQPTTEVVSDYTDTGLSPVQSKIVVLDPGHCGRHTGASGNGLREEKVTLDIALACQSYLDKYADITVYMTREDSGCCSALKLGDCLVARNNYAKFLSADFLVSMHINAGSSTGANVLTAYQSGYNDNVRKETQAFGKLALKKLSALGITNRGLLLRRSGNNTRYSNGRLADYYSIVRNGVLQNIPSVIIEHGYITSASDCNKFFKTAAKRKKVGQADAKAIIEYYGLSKKVVAGTFKKSGGATYYVGKNNTKLAGWVKSDGKWYYFDTMTGQMQSGFVTIGEDTFYLSPNTGEMITGWFSVNGKKYLARGNGSLVMKQAYSDGIYTYLFGEGGVQLKKGLHTINGETYYVNGKKRCAFGWVTYKGSKYYFNKKTGVMVTGWKKISGKYYYFNKTTGKMAKSKWIGKYYVNAKGIRTKKK